MAESVFDVLLDTREEKKKEINIDKDKQKKILIKNNEKSRIYRGTERKA